jgi:ribosome-associated protein
MELNAGCQKILNDSHYEYPLNVAYGAVWIAAQYHGLELKILEMKNKSSLADYFVIVTAKNPTSAQAMGDEIAQIMRRNKIHIRGVEGNSVDSTWILVDLGDVMVHIFLESSRGVYNLDELWADSPSIEIPTEYYFTDGQESDFRTNSSGNESTQQNWKEFF